MSQGAEAEAFQDLISAMLRVPGTFGFSVVGRRGRFVFSVVLEVVHGVLDEYWRLYVWAVVSGLR